MRKSKCATRPRPRCCTLSCAMHTAWRRRGGVGRGGGVMAVAATEQQRRRARDSVCARRRHCHACLRTRAALPPCVVLRPLTIYAAPSQCRLSVPPPLPGGVGWLRGPPPPPHAAPLSCFLLGALKLCPAAVLRHVRCVVRAQDGSTPLHYAAAEGHAPVVTLLCERGANKAATDRVRTRHAPVVVASLHQTPVTTRPRTLIQCALVFAHRVLLLMDKRPQRCRRVAPLHALFAQDGDTPLHYAAANGKVECVRVLVQRGADVASKNEARHATAACRARACLPLPHAGCERCAAAPCRGAGG
jgi:hypothetical protein